MSAHKDEKNSSNKLIAQNKKARFNYEIIETLECGIELKGTEVKSVKAGKISFNDSFVIVKENQLLVQGLHISPYHFGNLFNHDPDRKKRLLAHKEEIIKIKRKIDEKGMSIVPMSFYLKNGMVKLLIGIGRGKKLHDKRESIKAADLKRIVARELRSR